MKTHVSRREFIAAGTAGAFALIPALALRRRIALAPSLGPEPSFADIEHRVGGRLGVAAIDLATGRHVSRRGDERFPMCSTFKLLLAGLILSRVDAGRLRLDRVLPYSAADLLSYAPITRARVADGGMSIAALCSAAIEYSDNTAANLLLSVAGGPPALTSFARSLGDDVTRLDRVEPALNSAEPGDPRDTTTPAAMLSDARSLVTGDALSTASRDRLARWLLACTTGRSRLRAGLPASWRVGDKTGTGEHGATNDVAVAWPAPSRAPLLVAAYLTETSAPPAAREAALAEVGRRVRAALEAK